VATNLALSFAEKGFIIHQVYSRNIKNAKALGRKINAPFTDIISEIDKAANLYIISIADNAASDIVSQLDAGNSLVVHTSGSLDINKLNKFPNHGVFYPLQTFSKNKPVALNDIPILIEANTDKNTEILKQFAAFFTSKVHVMSSEQRRDTHLAAVFANNFTNHMYNIAERILKRSDISFDLLIPLINETARKVNDEIPCHVQTGPAVRIDKEIINKHLIMLADLPDYKKIYKQMTNSINKESKLIKI